MILGSDILKQGTYRWMVVIQASGCPSGAPVTEFPVFLYGLKYMGDREVSRVFSALMR